MMTTSDFDPATSDPNSERNSRSVPSLSRKKWVLVGLGLAALVAVASWFGWAQASQPVRWQDVGYDIVSASEATSTFDVYLYTDQPVRCQLRALNSRYAEVGVTDVDVDPADGAEQRLTVSMVTVEEATTVVVSYCEPQ
jgi:hypothetical protein